MSKEILKWKEETTFEKGMIVFNLILSISIIILSALALSGSWEGAIIVSQPLLGLLMLTQTVESWKYNKAVAIFSLVVALFIFGVVIIVFFFK